jgi:prolyl-tRNA synthetase
VDDRDQYSPGWKYNEYELRGVPVRIEVGPKDVAKEAVMTVQRVGRKKESVPLAELATRLPGILDEVQKALFESAEAYRRENTASVRNLEEIEAHFAERRGYAVMPWDGDDALEAEIKARTSATLRCMPLNTSAFEGTPKGSRGLALFARSY